MYWHCNTAICMRVCWKDCDFRDVYEWSHVCNCALFLSYISCHCMDVCLCLYRTTWTACRYFRIAFIYLLDIYKYIYFTPLPLAGYTAAWYVVWPMGPSNTTLWIKINIYLAKEITLKKCSYSMSWFNLRSCLLAFQYNFSHRSFHTALSARFTRQDSRVDSLKGWNMTNR